MFIAATFYMQLGNAEPFTLDDKLKPYQITLEEIESGNGSKGGAAVGTLASDPQYLFVKGLSALRATQVTFIPLTEGDSFKLEVAKNNWESVISSCESKGGESCYIDFKTFDGAGFKVSGSPKGSWLLAVLTSPELSASAIMPTPLYEANKADAAKLAVIDNVLEQPTAESNSFMLMIIIVLLAIIVTLLFYFVYKRNSGHVGLLLLISIGALHDGDANADNIYFGSDPSQFYSPPSPGEIVGSPLYLDNSEQASYDRLNPRPDITNTPYKDITKFDKKVMGELSSLNKRYKALKSMKKLADSWSDLSNCSKISNPPNAPRIPTFCEDDEDCTQCYADARVEFDFVRGIYEQLRVVYKCTKSFSDDAIAFGDNVSGLHAVSGIAWQSARVGIKDSVTKLQQSYDRKYAELTNSLQKSMMAMNSCEAEWGVPDWYDRFGFMYFEFITDKYKRSD